MRIKLVSGETHRTVTLPPKDVHRLAAACPAPLAGDAILLAAYTGLRKGELLGLTRQHVHGDEIRLRSDTKSGRPRIVPVPPHALPLLAKVPLGLSENELRRNFEAARAAIGREDLRFHDLRHCYASWLIQNGADLVTVRDLLGHSTIQITADLYSHLLTAHLREAVKRLPAGEKSVTIRSQRKATAKP
jgi:integrase